MESKSMNKKEINAYNAGIITAQHQITKAMLALQYNNDIDENIRNLLRFIYDELEKELK
jgi:hypothetical protein